MFTQLSAILTPLYMIIHVHPNNIPIFAVKMYQMAMDIPIFWVQKMVPPWQVLIHYGHRYWLPESRRHVRLPTQAAEGRTGPRGQGYQGYQG